MPYNLYIRPGRRVKLQWFRPVRNSGSDSEEWVEGYFEKRAGVVEKLGQDTLHLEGDPTPYPLAHVAECWAS